MTMLIRPARRQYLGVGLVVATWLLTGCGPSSQPSASGHVNLARAGDFRFAGDSLELRSQTNPTQLAFGAIQEDGSFQIESLTDGRVTTGAPPGSYQARIVISDDDYQHKAAAMKVIAKKYLNFSTSNLVIEVPSQNIQLNLSE